MNAENLQMQIMWDRLISIVEEQAQVIMRTAFSPLVREAGDLSAGVFDARGRMMAQAVTGTPGHVNSMALTVGHVLEKFPVHEMEEGDVFITNDPWLGTGHLNDFVVVTPCFRDGAVIGAFACTSHQMDLGGLGMTTDSREIFHEGLQIPIVRLAMAGRVDETLMMLIRANTRFPVDTEGDTYSLVASNEVAGRLLREMMDDFEIDTLEPLADHIFKVSRDAVVANIGDLPKGRWSSLMTLDGFDEPIELRATVAIGEDAIHVDFAGTSGAVARSVNVPLCYTTAYTAFGLGCIIATGIPNNFGSLSAITVSAPEGCIVNAARPSAVQSRHIIGHMLPDVVFGCLSQAIPDRVPAEGAGTLWGVQITGQAKGRRYAVLLTSSGGMGALPSSDGPSATGYPSGVRSTPVEIVEAMSPLVFWRKELRPDSGGAGRARGGLGQTIEVGTRGDEPFRLHATYERINFPARGRDGGEPGAPGALFLGSGQPLSGKGDHIIPPGERLKVLTPGGGGIGDPKSRQRESVGRDLSHELISDDAATRIYGHE